MRERQQPAGLVLFTQRGLESELSSCQGVSPHSAGLCDAVETPGALLEMNESLGAYFRRWGPNLAGSLSSHRRVPKRPSMIEPPEGPSLSSCHTSQK